MKKYHVELEGQKEFYSEYLKRINNNLSIDELFEYEFLKNNLKLYC